MCSLLSPRPSLPSFARWITPVIGALGLGAACLLVSPRAHAHFTLISPTSWVIEDSLGNPQKLAPCGGDYGLSTERVSTYRAGSTIMVEWQETVGHPGHFRISFAEDRARLIDPAVVTTTGDGVTGNSISAAIMDPPVPPVLLDGLFPREGVVNAHEGPFEVEVTLPEMTCEKCTLQVIQFMANHEPGFFYHHCADVRLVATDAEIPPELPDEIVGGQGGSGGSGVVGTAGSMSVDSAEDADEGGCTFTMFGPGKGRAGVPLLMLGIGAMQWRRRLAR